MIASQRREKILELIKEDGQAKVINLSRLFKVTEVTIRQDLEKLERDGYLVREHGGAYLKRSHDILSIHLFRIIDQEHH